MLDRCNPIFRIWVLFSLLGLSMGQWRTDPARFSPSQDESLPKKLDVHTEGTLLDYMTWSWKAELFLLLGTHSNSIWTEVRKLNNICSQISTDDRDRINGAIPVQLDQHNGQSACRDHQGHLSPQAMHNRLSSHSHPMCFQLLSWTRSVTVSNPLKELKFYLDIFHNCITTFTVD